MEKSNLKIYFTYLIIGGFAIATSFVSAQFILRSVGAQSPPQVDSQVPAANKISPEIQKKIMEMQMQIQETGKVSPGSGTEMDKLSPEIQKQIIKMMEQSKSLSKIQPGAPVSGVPNTVPDSTPNKASNLPSINELENAPPTGKLEMNNPSMNAPQESNSGTGRLVKGTEFDLILEPYNYDPNGRRDPFQRVQIEEGTGQSFPLLPLEKFDLAQIKLTGIIWDVNNPKAMFMDPNDKVHILGKNQRIGRNKGYIAVIREGEVVIVEAGLEGAEEAYNTKILRVIGDE